MALRTEKFTDSDNVEFVLSDEGRRITATDLDSGLVVGSTLYRDADRAAKNFAKIREIARKMA